VTLDAREEALRARFGSPPEGSAAVGVCPAADRIWLAARGELPWDDVQTLLEHVASCPACTVAWRLAREQHRSEGGVAAAPRSARGSRWVRYAGAAAVLAVAAILLTQVPWRRALEEPYRATAPNAIRSLVPDDGVLPRSAMTLRWTAGPPGSRYSIAVTDERLTPVADAFSLDRPEFQVPEKALAGLKEGDRLLWQVKATLPDGVRVTSETFATRVGAP